MYMADESQLPTEAITIFAWSSKKKNKNKNKKKQKTKQKNPHKNTNAVLSYPDGRLCSFY